MAAKLGLRAEGIGVRPDTGQFTRIAELIATGDLKPIIASVWTLEEATEAHKLSESGHVHGKIVLKVR